MQHHLNEAEEFENWKRKLQQQQEQQTKQTEVRVRMFTYSEEDKLNDFLEGMWEGGIRDILMSDNRVMVVYTIKCNRTL